MKKQELIKVLEDFAPLETQENWDNSGWQILTGKENINKAMLCLSVTKDVIEQAKQAYCDIIISHHPLFYVPFSFNQGISIYSAHTNLDKARGGTTDRIIELLGYKNTEKIEDFVRTVSDNTTLDEFILKLKIALNLSHIRVSNNNKINKIRKIAFCAGSGSEFEDLAIENGADVLVTGDVKYHKALDSKIVLIDIGHFESEIPIVNTLEKLLKDKVEIVIAKEKSPFQYC